MELNGESEDRNIAGNTNPNTIECSICGHSFKNITEYTHHLKVHFEPDEKVKEESPCQQDRITLKTPMTGSFWCTLCNKSFAISDDLTAHLNTIHGVGTFTDTPIPLVADVSSVKVECKSGAENKDRDSIDTVNNTHASKLRTKKRGYREQQDIIDIKEKLMKYESQNGQERLPPASEETITKAKHVLQPNGQSLAMSSSENMDGSKKLQYWGCTICKANFNGRPELVTHISNEHVTITDSKCNICGTSLLTKQAAREHIAQHATIQCALCKEENIETFEALEHHLLDKHSNDTMCTICPSEFRVGYIEADVGIVPSQDLVSHIIEHQKRYDKRKCPSCHHYHKMPAVRWQNTNSLINHNITLGKMECCFCNYTHVVDMKLMRLHLLHKHEQEIRHAHFVKKTRPKTYKKRKGKSTGKSDRIWKCRMCEWTRTGQKGLLLAHFIHEHTQTIGPTCVICNAEITLDKIGLDHILSHTTILCALCKQEDLPTIPALEQHLTEKHSEVLCLCPVCEAHINKPENIVSHMVNHQRETNKHKCPTCLQYHKVPTQMSSSSKIKDSTLMVHNTKLGALQCSLCEYTCFTRNGYATMKVHLIFAHRDYFESVEPVVEDSVQSHNENSKSLESKEDTDMSQLINKPREKNQYSNDQPREQNMERHQVVGQDINGQTTCSLCNESFLNSAGLKRHIRYVHARKIVGHDVILGVG